MIAKVQVGVDRIVNWSSFYQRC